jgi:hypothetical protein
MTAWPGSKQRGQILAGASRSGRGFYYGGRRVLLMNEPGAELVWAGDGVAQFSEDVLEATFSTLQQRALGYMRGVTPEDSGDLIRSEYAVIRVEGGRAVLAIGAEEPYAIFVELGTSTHRAQPFIRPTFDWLASVLMPTLQAESAARGGL